MPKAFRELPLAKTFTRSGDPYHLLPGIFTLAQGTDLDFPESPAQRRSNHQHHQRPRAEAGGEAESEAEEERGHGRVEWRVEGG